MTVSSTARHYKPLPDDYLQSALVAVQSRLAGRGVDIAISETVILTTPPVYPY